MAPRCLCKCCFHETLSAMLYTAAPGLWSAGSLGNFEVRASSKSSARHSFWRSGVTWALPASQRQDEFPGDYLEMCCCVLIIVYSEEHIITFVTLYREPKVHFGEDKVVPKYLLYQLFSWKDKDHLFSKKLTYH